MTLFSCYSHAPNHHPFNLVFPPFRWHSLSLIFSLTKLEMSKIPLLPEIEKKSALAWERERERSIRVFLSLRVCAFAITIESIDEVVTEEAARVRAPGHRPEGIPPPAGAQRWACPGCAGPFLLFSFLFSQSFREYFDLFLLLFFLWDWLFETRDNELDFYF